MPDVVGLVHGIWSLDEVLENRVGGRLEWRAWRTMVPRSGPMGQFSQWVEPQNRDMKHLSSWCGGGSVCESR